MIIWRGLGFLAVVLLGAGAGLSAAAASAMLGSGNADADTLGAGIGLILGGVVTYFVGQWLNVTRPKAKIESLMAAKSTELHAAADAGTFHMGPGNHPPKDVADAHRQADEMLAELRPRVEANLKNEHSLFWIPMQYIGIIGAMLGAAIFVGTLVS